jgi:hypothetical protein
MKEFLIGLGIFGGVTVAVLPATYGNRKQKT